MESRSLEDVLHIDIDWIFQHLTLLEHACARRTSKNLCTLLEQKWRTTTDRLLTSGEVLPADVKRGWHTSLFRWMLDQESIARIRLAPGSYVLGDYTNPLHVEKVPDAAELELQDAVASDPDGSHIH